MDLIQMTGVLIGGEIGTQTQERPREGTGSRHSSRSQGGGLQETRTVRN